MTVEQNWMLEFCFASAQALVCAASATFIFDLSLRWFGAVLLVVFLAQGFYFMLAPRRKPKDQVPR